MTATDGRNEGASGSRVITTQRRADLQGMRAVAVLAVFANHLFGWPHGGFVGVDVFFVLSGFFITGLLIRERKKQHRLSFKDFYIRRVKRIIPSALLVLVVTVIGSYVLFTETRAKDTLVDALYAAVFASNWHFEAVGADYFEAARLPSPVQHYWSLSIEEQFYFAWPYLLAGVFLVTRPLVVKRGRFFAREWGMFAVMGTIVAASFSWAMYLSMVDGNAAYFSTFTRVWELGVGALVAICGPWLERIPDRVRPVLAYVGLAGVVASLLLINPEVQFPAPWAALPVLSTAVVVASFHGAPVPTVMAPLTNRVARYFGDTSYTLYLWHFPVLTLLLAVMPKSPLYYSLAIVIALALTDLTYRLYENPIRNSDWLESATTPSRFVPKIPIEGWAGVGGAAAIAAVIGILLIGYNDRVAAAERAIAAKESRSPISFGQPERQTDPCFGAPAMLNAKCVLRNPENPLQPSVDEFTKDTAEEIAATRCRQRPDGESCDYGYMGPDATRLALVGDSHAGQFLPALLPMLEANKWRLTTFIGTGCYLAIPPAGRCIDRMEQIRSELLSEPYAAVIVTNFGGNVAPIRFERAWKPLLQAGKRVIVVIDNPRTSAEALQCLSRVSIGGDQTAQCGVSRDEAFPQPDPLLVAAQNVPGTTVVDLTPLYCTADWCPSVIGDVIVYRDHRDDGNTHITTTFATTLSPALEEQLKLALAAPRP